MVINQINSIKIVTFKVKLLLLLVMIKEKDLEEELQKILILKIIVNGFKMMVLLLLV
jgi:hypothetical protein